MHGLYVSFKYINSNELLCEPKPDKKKKKAKEQKNIDDDEKETVLCSALENSKLD